MKIKCTVCNKEFYYGDHNSPMFIDEVWNKIINYFKLTNFEKEAAKKFSSYYKGGGKDTIYKVLKANNIKIRKSNAKLIA
jgi:hypothetical protein